MNYYKASQYNERWFARFKDLLNADWRISIEDPTFVGEATELLGAAEPFEWMGQGDEKQDSCVNGSTGYLRIVVEDETAIEDLRPTELNNRRVTAKRDGVIVWQGFLKQEEYSQDWVSAPYELELPVVSALELAKDMPLPDYSATVANKRFIHTLLPYMVELLGVDVRYLISNYSAHIGVNGYADGSYWITGNCNIEYFYTFGNSDIEPGTVYDVLEAIFYPWGRLCEKGDKWYAITYDKLSEVLYQFDMESPDDGMTELEDSYAQMLLSSIQSCSTDNTRSYIAAPKSVTFKLGIETDDTILSLAENMIPNTYTCIYSNLTVSQKDSEYRYLCGVDNVDNGRFAMSGGSYVRVLSREETSHDNSITIHDYNVVVPLGISVSTANCVIIPNQRVLTKVGYNHIKQTLRIYDANGWEVDDDTDLMIGSNALVSTATGFYRDGNSFTRFVHATSALSIPQMLVFSIKSSGANYIIVPTFEYVKVEENSEAAIVGEFLSGLDEHSYYKQGNGSGDALSIEFKTLCGGLKGARNNICVPFNGFNDSMNLVDLFPRYMLDLSAVRPADPMSFILDPILVIDGALRYVPVAVGMNARDCTTQLKLVSSNSGLLDAGLVWTPNTTTYDISGTDSWTSPTFSKATSADVSFVSSDEDIATVDENGVITLNDVEGTAIITARSAANDSYRAGVASVAITVVDSANDKKEANLAWSGAERITFDYADGEAFESPEFSKDTTAEVTFESDNEDVAVVDEDGVVSLVANALGTARITAESEENDEYEAGSAYLQITVKNTGKTLRLDYASAYAVQLVGVKGWDSSDTDTYFLEHNGEQQTFTASDVIDNNTIVFTDPIDRNNWEATDGITLILNIE